MLKDWQDTSFQETQLRKGQRKPTSLKPARVVEVKGGARCQYCGELVKDCECGILLPWRIAGLQRMKGYKRHEALDT
jgi:hypothetical protein